MKTFKNSLIVTVAFAALICYSPNLAAQSDESDERTPADAFEWLQSKMELFDFDNYYGYGRKRYNEEYKYTIMGFEGCVVKIQEDYKYVRQIRSTKDDRDRTKEWTIDFAEVAMIEDNSESYKPHYTLKARNELDKFVYKYSYSDNSYTTSTFDLYIDELGELTDEPERFTDAIQFLIDKCEPPKKKEKF